MAIVERSNVVLQIPDDEIQRYLDKGYSVTDGEGHIIQQAIPNNVGDLQRLVVEQKQTIDELLRKLQEYENTSIDDSEFEEIIVEEKPKRRGRKSTK